MFRKSFCVYFLTVFLLSQVSHHSVAVAQQLPSCDIRALNQRWENGQFGETVPPAPVELDLNGDGIVDSTDWLTCTFAFQNYMGQCDLHTLDDVFSQPCRGTPTDIPNTVGLPQCPGGVGPNGIVAGIYPNFLSAESRQWLWEVFGHTGAAPSDYSGEGCVQSGNNAPPPQPNSTVAMLEPATGLRVRTGGSTSCQQIGTIRPGTSYTIEGKNSGSTWLQITYNGQPGWVSADFVRINDPSLMFVVPQLDSLSSCVIVIATETPHPQPAAADSETRVAPFNECSTETRYTILPMGTAEERVHNGFRNVFANCAEAEGSLFNKAIVFGGLEGNQESTSTASVLTIFSAPTTGVYDISATLTINGNFGVGTGSTIAFPDIQGTLRSILLSVFSLDVLSAYTDLAEGQLSFGEAAVSSDVFILVDAGYNQCTNNLRVAGEVGNLLNWASQGAAASQTVVITASCRLTEGDTVTVEAGLVVRVAARGWAEAHWNLTDQTSYVNSIMISRRN